VLTAGRLNAFNKAHITARVTAMMSGAGTAYMVVDGQVGRGRTPALY
jgi:hypothetical protein